MSELGVASRRPLLPNESQVNASIDSSGCCWKISWMARRTMVSTIAE